MKRIYNLFFLPVLLASTSLTYGQESQPTTAPTTEPSSQPSGSAFEEHLNYKPLDESDKLVLKTYLDTLVARLNQAREDAKGKTFEEAKNIYIPAIKQVILASFDKHRVEETLSRAPLVQAFELTFGIPNPDGVGVKTPGTLQATENQDLLIVILEDSIEMALRFAPKDIEAVQKGDLSGLPYLQFAYQRLLQGREWLTALFNWKDSNALSVALIRHWFNIVNSENNLHRAGMAEAIDKADSILRGQVDAEPRNYNDLIGSTRQLRKTLRKISESGNSLGVFDQATPAPLEPSTDREQVAGGTSRFDRMTFKEALEVAAQNYDYSKRNLMIYERIYVKRKTYFGLDNYDDLHKLLSTLSGGDGPWYYSTVREKVVADYYARHSSNMNSEQLLKLTPWLVNASSRNFYIRDWVLSRIHTIKKDELTKLLDSLNSGEGKYYYSDVRAELSDAWLNADEHQ